jgi:hypothetical protein
MVRLKKPVDYVNRLVLNPNSDIRKLGENLQKQYGRWKRSLDLKHLLNFMKTIQENRDKIGVAQLFGRFRAYSFEEFVYRLIQAKVSIPPPFNVCWGEKCLIWRDDDREYGMELDVVVGRKFNKFVVEPLVAVEAKVELDASRLKTALASFLLLKERYPNVKCYLVYMFGEIDSFLMKLTAPWIDGIYEFSQDKDETTALVRSVQEAVKHA